MGRGSWTSPSEADREHRGSGWIAAPSEAAGEPFKPAHSQAESTAAAHTVGVELHDLAVRYDGQRVLDGVDLRIEAGSIVTLLGASGCGKTTLLRVLGGLLRPDRGHLRWIDAQGESVAAPTLGYCFQDGRLLPWRNLEQNLCLALESGGSLSRLFPALAPATAPDLAPPDLAPSPGRTSLDRATRKQLAREILERVGLGAAASLYPHQVSGGMRMRAAVARALIHSPQLLLLDEPFASVDALTRLELDELIIDLWRQRPMTVVWVTHSIEEASMVSQAIYVLRPQAEPSVQRWSIPEGPRGMAGKNAAQASRLSQELLETLREPS